ncbi:hypothetical protein OC834_007427 [Tilletia horrida]|uniref:Uncharacterized protein n=1 Tax=Tilletia horrida TaxID=155126 RepID=A0AAN6G6L5_9BASI|nr:hypothetical protein OC834_007427 [Tilletia horrida]KAK0519345.1 hypothetical protein OC842_007483 [Tilletia horrida]
MRGQLKFYDELHAKSAEAAFPGAVFVPAPPKLPGTARSSKKRKKRGARGGKK